MHHRITPALAASLALVAMAPACASTPPPRADHAPGPAAPVTASAPPPLAPPTPVVASEEGAPDDAAPDEGEPGEDRNGEDRNGDGDSGCTDGAPDELTRLAVAIELSNHGLAERPPAELACDAQWTRSCGAVGAIACSTYDYSTTETSNLAEAPLELIAMQPATITLDGVAYELHGTAQKVDRRDVTVDLAKRRAAAVSDPQARGARIPVDFTIAVGSASAQGRLLLSADGLFPELAGLGRGPVLWPGETPKAASQADATGLLFVDGASIAEAFPTSLETTLGRVRYLARLATKRPAALCEFGARPEVERQLRIEVFDRFSGKRVVDEALPSFATDASCSDDERLAWPAWVYRAYAPELAAIANRVLGRVERPWPAIDANAAGPRALLARPLGLTQPTLAGLLALVHGDRARLAELFGRHAGATIALDGTNLTELTLGAATAQWLANAGIRDPLAELIGHSQAAVEALLGPPDGAARAGRKDLNFSLVRPGVLVRAHVQLKKDRVFAIRLEWRSLP